MKKFISENWYKLMLGSSLLMASFGFMIYSVTSVNAEDLSDIASNLKYQQIPVNADGSVSVKLSDEQLNKIIPKNEDGSINIKLSEQQLKKLTPNAIQAVNIEEVLGHNAACYPAYDLDGDSYYSLGVRESNPW